MNEVKKIELSEDLSGKLALLDLNGVVIHDCNIGRENEQTLEYIKDRALLQIQNIDFSKKKMELYLMENGSFIIKFE